MMRCSLSDGTTITKSFSYCTVSGHEPTLRNGQRNASMRFLGIGTTYSIAARNLETPWGVKKDSRLISDNIVFFVTVLFI